jgi:DNA invertase Pin-like site-specific DNA recombinase
MIGIYVRVSTDKQVTASQEHDLRQWAKTQRERVRWFRDHGSGKTFERDGWKKLDAQIARGAIQRLVVWRLDRLGREAGAVISLLDDLDRQGVAFLSLRDGFDPSTPAGRLTRNVLCSVAQFETEVRSDRVRAGIAAARARGKCWGGRKPGTRITLTPKVVAAVKRMKHDGKTSTEVAELLHISRKSVWAIVSGRI